MARLVIDGYGQLELNQVAFRRDGRVEAQCALSTDDFSAAAPCEVGMLLAVDKANRKIKLPTANEKLPIALNYSTEHMYDERANALKNFFMVPGEFLPRMGYLDIGDRFTTNCIDLGSYADLAAVKTAMASGIVYAGACTNGAIQLTGSTKPSFGPVLQVVKVYTMPDGTPGVKFMCLEA